MRDAYDLAASLGLGLIAFGLVILRLSVGV